MFFLSHLVYQNDLHVRLRPILKYHPAATFILIIDDDIYKYQHLFSIYDVIFATENFQNLCGSPIEPPANKQYDLDAADDGEPSEEPHGSPNEAQLCLHLDLLVSLDLIKGRRVKVDLNQLKS